MTNFLVSQLFIRPTYPRKDRTGQTVIITGANIGLGLEAARHFVRLNAKRVILAVRSVEKGEAAKEDIEKTTGKKGVVSVWTLDLASYASVKAFAKRASTELDRVDALIENAGIATPHYRVSEDNESTITTNVISTFLLALLMLPVLRKSAKQYNITPTLTIVSSEVHAWTDLPEYKASDMYAALNDKNSAAMSRRYPTSKLLEVLYVHALCARLPDQSVIVNMLNPGLCHSGLAREIESWNFTLMKFFLARTTEMGSRTLVAAADAGEESFGEYMSDGVVAETSKFVRSGKGRIAEEKVWRETNEKLEKIQPGILDVIKG